MKRDELIFDIIEKEHQRQLKGIELIASENGCGHVFTQVTAASTVILARILSVRFGISLPSLKPIDANGADS